ncbi:hypothetical protein IV203_021085 [Nitzschia inconspicua]|uniref:Uncharacterized protein n=1 Tax=Nitzschia inconspicua TaxID=303405 RepID=A0A9K3KH97_9STRA|nr:hypothetical protein IV203_021085 [Nitzschia inconspicua]
MMLLFRASSAAAVFFAAFFFSWNTSSARLTEDERLLQYEKRGYEWPIKAFKPNTEGWNTLMNERLNQVSEIDDETERYKGYVTTLFPALVVSNLTEYGWAMTRISDDLLNQLQQGIRDGFDDKQEEGRTPIIEGNQAWWIERDDLMDKVEDELHGPLEEWCGTDLSLTKVYGLRLFRNESSFRMHIDKKGSHSVGYVLHVASSEDTKPWPFFIEDFHGRTHEINLTPGDVIMFEAGKLMHGRPRTLNGSWYSNVVGHYYPNNEEWVSMEHQREAEYAVPPHWGQPAPFEKKFNRLELRGGLKEPDCVDGWCRSDSKTTVKWNGPGDFGSWLDPAGAKHKFHSRNSEFSMEL